MPLQMLWAQFCWGDFKCFGNGGKLGEFSWSSGLYWALKVSAIQCLPAYQFPKPRKSPRHLPLHSKRQRSIYQSDSGTLLNFCSSIPELISPSSLELMKALILMLAW